MVANPGIGSETPAGATVNPADIPGELRAIPQWVCWRYEERTTGELKRTKVPYQLDGRRASSIAPPHVDYLRAGPGSISTWWI